MKQFVDSLATYSKLGGNLLQGESTSPHRSHCVNSAMAVLFNAASVLAPIPYVSLVPCEAADIGRAKTRFGRNLVICLSGAAKALHPSFIEACKSLAGSHVNHYSILRGIIV
jgi:hypothetical protein